MSKRPGLVPDAAIKKKRAVITGVSGQDGAYLSAHLLERGYEVFGLHSSASAGDKFWRLREVGALDRVQLLQTDLSDGGQLESLLSEVRPDEFYNLAAHSHIISAANQPLQVSQLNGLAPAHMLDAIERIAPECRFCQASSADMFGAAQESPQSETTPMRPGNPYAISKVFAHFMTGYYRQSRGLFACSAILFNHESPLRGADFVTRKITAGLARLAAGQTTPLELGNLDARRDWGFAADYMEGMWLMLQAESPDDYVLATGVTHSVAEFAQAAADALGLKLHFERDENGHWQGLEGPGGRCLIRTNPQFLRAGEAQTRVGDASRARRQLGWSPRQTFAELAGSMAVADKARLEVPAGL